MRNKLISGVAAGIVCLGLGSPAFGNMTFDDSAASAEPNSVLAEARAGQAQHIKYELEASAALYGFIPVSGKAEFDLKLNGGNTYNINTKVKTTGIADLFVDYDLHVAASGYVLNNDLMTYNYVSQNHDGKKNRRVELTYGADDVEMVANPGYGDLGFPPATPEQKLEARDPITAFMASGFRARTAENPCGPTIKFFDGKQLTHMSFKYVRDTNIKTKGWSGKAIECHVLLERLAGYNEGDKGKNLSGIDGPMKMYFGEVTRGFVAPVKLVVDTDTPAGRITVQVRRFFIKDIEG